MPTFTHNLASACVVSILCIAYAVSSAALIFSGALGAYFATGVEIAMISSAALSFGIALRSKFPIAVGGPDMNSVAVLAVMAAAITGSIPAGHEAQILPTVSFALCLSALLCGVFFWALGRSRTAYLIRFIPYHVVGAFVAIAGWYMISGATRILSGSDLLGFLRGGGLQSAYQTPMLFAVLIAVLLFLATKHLKHSAVIPGVVLGVILLFHTVAGVNGYDIQTLQESGWLFVIPQPAHILPDEYRQWEMISWESLFQVSELAVIILVLAMTITLTSSAIELSTGIETDIEHEMRAHGGANLLSALFGGFAGGVALNRSMLNLRSGATAPLSGYLIAFICILVLVTGVEHVVYLPKMAIAGLLMFMGYGNLHRWLIQSRRLLSLADYLTLVAILLMTIMFGLMPGIFVGLVGSCVVFVFRYGRIHPIRNALCGSQWRSVYLRPMPEKQLLLAHGKEILILKLQGYLFFGSATKISDAIQEKLATSSQPSIVILDFKAVTGVDSSAVMQLKKIADRLAEVGITSIYCECGEGLQALVHPLPGNASENMRYVPDFDAALQQAEDRLIARYQAPPANAEQAEDWLAEWLGDAALSEQLLSACERLEVEAGTCLCREGERAEGLYLIMEGLIDVQTQQADGTKLLLSRIGRASIIGEMALLEATTRMATLTTARRSVVYMLTRERFDALRRNQPQLTDSIYRNLLLDASKRLQNANMLIRQLSI